VVEASILNAPDQEIVLPLYTFKQAVFVLCVAWLCAPSAFAQNSSTRGDRQRLEEVTRRLTSAEFDGRMYKTEGGQKAARYLADLFRDLGLKPVAGRADYFQPIAGGGQNVVGMIPGRDPARANEFVILGAHYDAFDRGFVGAADNAAGVAVMLEIARLATRMPPQRSLLFIAFDGEEQNLVGSQFYAEHPLVPLEKTAAVVVLNNFGRGMAERFYEMLYVLGAEVSPQLREAVAKHKRDEASLVVAGNDVIKGPESDHYHFNLKQVPTLFVTNGVHFAFHSRKDTADRINYAALEKHTATLAKLLLEIANTPRRVERQSEPVYDSEEASDWHRVLTALREAVIKVPENDAGLRQVDAALNELKRYEGRAIQDPRAREAVIVRAVNIILYIANPGGVRYTSLYQTARAYEQRGDRTQAVAAYKELLKFIDEEYRRDDQTVREIRQRLARLGG